MTIELIAVGKTDSQAVDSLVSVYMKRINAHTKFSTTYIPDIRNAGRMPVPERKRAEGERILKLVADGDCVVLLDNNGRQPDSIELAAWLENKMVTGCRRLVFIIGGAYGFSPAVHERADMKLSLSRMTFSHQIIRAIFAEQLYRAFSIIRNEPYHNE